MRLVSIFYGRVQVVYSWGRYGWTRGGGKVWHGGLDLVGLDDTTVRMPYYKGKKITGKVVRARIVLDRSNKTWEWGYYVCVQLDANQTPDAVNFLYFCHCSSLLVQVGQKVSSGDALAVMGRTGNAALGDCPYDHCHLEVRATATGMPWAFMARQRTPPRQRTGKSSSTCPTTKASSTGRKSPTAPWCASATAAMAPAS